MGTGSLMLAFLLGASPAPADVFHINQQQLKIPISIDPSRRAEVKELKLFVSADEGRTWNQQAVASPEQEAFSFYAPKDGLYWFSVAVVNQQGRQEPADIAAVPPNQKLMIDTVKPVLRIKSAERRGEDIAVSWEMQEDHPNLSTLKLEFHSADAPSYQWTPVAVPQEPTGQGQFRSPSGGAVTVRMQVQDLAGNAASTEVEVAALAGAGNGQLASMTPPSPVGGQPLPVPPAMPPPTPPSAGTIQNSAWEVPPATNHQVALTRPNPQPVDMNYPPPVASGYPLVKPPLQDPNSHLVASSARTMETGASTPSSVAPPRPMAGALPSLQIVNTKQVGINYEVTKKGPSGIGKVELWITQDEGRTWQKFTETADSNPPMKVDLPEEGVVYGFRLVLQSKAGRYKPPPAPNDPPEMRLELDTTAPKAELYQPIPDPKQNDALVLKWAVRDKNPAADPVTLEWSDRSGGNWQVIMKGLPNEGRYTWKVPTGTPYLVHLRLVARDLAGNVCEAITPEPICIDLLEPDGKLLGLAKNPQPLEGPGPR